MHPSIRTFCAASLSTSAKRTHSLLAAAAALASVLAITPARADVLTNVQFGATGPQASDSFSGAAVIGQAGDYWNYFQAASGTAAPLADSTGATSGLSLDFTAQGDYGLQSGTSAFTGTSYASLMQAFVYHADGDSVTATFSGLAAGQQFNLSLYSQSDASSGSSYGGSFTVNGVSQAAMNDASASTFTSGVNYLEFSGTADALGQVDLTSVTAPGRSQVILNGLQLDAMSVSVPEPASLAVFGFGLVGLAGALRHRKMHRTSAAA